MQRGAPRRLAHLLRGVLWLRGREPGRRAHARRPEVAQHREVPSLQCVCPQPRAPRKPHAQLIQTAPRRCDASTLRLALPALPRRNLLTFSLSPATRCLSPTLPLPPRRTTAFLQILLTLLGVLIVAATYESYPALFKGAPSSPRFSILSPSPAGALIPPPTQTSSGVPAPAPPPAHESPNHVLLSEFAVTFSVLFAGGLLSRAAGRVPGAFLGSLFYWVVAYAEAGAYSGAIMNPASILALHVYKEVDKPKAWAEAAPRVAPYAAGAAAAALLLGLYNRGRAAGAGGGAGGAGGARPAMSKAAAERRQRAMKAE